MDTYKTTDPFIEFHITNNSHVWRKLNKKCFYLTLSLLGLIKTASVKVLYQQRV